jgi:hypothetical protein
MISMIYDIPILLQEKILVKSINKRPFNYTYSFAKKSIKLKFPPACQNLDIYYKSAII